MKNKYHNVGIFQKLNRKIVETDNISISFSMVKVIVFNVTYFRYIVVLSFIGGGNRSTGENHRPAASH